MITNEGYKKFLLRRMLQAIVSSVVVQFFLVSSVIFFSNFSIIHPLVWIQTTWSTVFCLRMLSYFLLLAVTIFIQGFICSKNYLNPPYYARSRFTKFCSLFSLRNLFICSLYVLISGILAWLHLSLNGAKYSALSRDCRVEAAGRCFVEGYYFLILSGFWTGLYFVIKSDTLEAQHLDFPVIPQTKFSQLRRGIYIVLPNAALSAIWPALYFLAIYYLLGNSLRGFMLTLTSFSLEDEPLNRIPGLFQPNLLYHAWLHALLFVLSMNSMHLLFQAYLTEWVPFAIEQNSLPEDPSKIVLTRALGTADVPIVQHLAFLDLLAVARKDKPRRELLFALSQPGGHPYNWNCVVEQCLSVIKDFSSHVNSTTTSAKKDQMQVNGPTLAKSVITGDAEKPVVVYHMRNLASPSVPSPTKAVSCEIPKQSVPGEQMVAHYVKLCRQNVATYLLSKPLINYVFAEQMDAKVRHVLLNAQPVVWAASAISTLVAVSIKEDPYGIAQKDLPAVIETLLNAKESLDKLQKTNVLVRRPVSDDKDVRQMFTAMRLAIRRSIYRIVCTFRNYIDDLGLEPYTVTQLQMYFNFRE